MTVCLNSCQSWLIDLDWGSLCKISLKVVRSFLMIEGLPYDKNIVLIYTWCWLAVYVKIKWCCIMSKLLMFRWEESWHVGRCTNCSRQHHWLCIRINKLFRLLPYVDVLIQSIKINPKSFLCWSPFQMHGCHHNPLSLILNGCGYI